MFGLEVDAVTFSVVPAQCQCASSSSPCLHAPYLDKAKSQASDRVVPLAKVTTDALAAHLARHPVREAPIEDRSEPRKPVTRPARLMFSTPSGAPVSRPLWSKIWQPAARAVGVPARVGLHALRHFYASALIQHGESVRRCSGG